MKINSRNLKLADVGVVGVVRNKTNKLIVDIIEVELESRFYKCCLYIHVDHAQYYYFQNEDDIVLKGKIKMDNGLLFDEVENEIFGFNRILNVILKVEKHSGEFYIWSDE